MFDINFILRFFACLSLCLLSAGSVRAADNLYGQNVVIPVGASRTLKASAEDVAQVLGKMTGRDFSVSSEYTGAGIWLVRADAPEAPAGAKQLNGREPFLIRSNDTNRLWIVANRDEGLQHGLYFYLEQLGVRFYFPNDNWTIVPQKQDVSLKIDRLIAPDFRLRSFFGTGGFGPKMPIDPNQQIKDRWSQWQRRNRFGGEFTIGGHTGEAFNAAHKEILLKNPEYLAKVDGNHVPWSPAAKLNTANPDAVKLYVDWSVERYRKARAAQPAAPSSFAVSVDPADGGGHCNSEECLQIGSGSVSDQVFYVANQVAKAVAKEFPDGYVSLYAYNQHADVPTIPLEPNIYVQVIPYAFQTTGLTPVELIRAWDRKIDQLGIYDYWSIPDWSGDLPSFNYLRTPDEKLKLWHENQIKAFSAESTYSAGAMGIGWYLGSRMMWDLKTDQQALLNEFYETAFGAARPPMQRMLERWATTFKLTRQELALSYRDLEEAHQLAKTPEVRARLADYSRYVEYMRLQHEATLADKEQKPAAQAALVRYIWSIYGTAMIHSYRQFQLETRGNIELRNAYDMRNAEAEAWKSVSAPTDEDAAGFIARGVQDYQPLDFTPRNFSGELVALPGVQATPAPDTLPSFFPVGSTKIEINAQPGQSTLPLRINGPTRVQLLDAAGKVLFDKELEFTGDLSALRDAANLQPMNIPLPRPGRYLLVLRTAKNASTHLQLPHGYQMTLEQLRTSKPLRSPRLYFYVPQGLQKLALYLPDSLPEIMEVRFYDPQGQKVKPEHYDGRRIYLVDIPQGQDGKIWSLDNLVSPNYTPEILNAPQAFALYPDALMVPKEALTP